MWSRHAGGEVHRLLSARLAALPALPEPRAAAQAAAWAGIAAVAGSWSDRLVRLEKLHQVLTAEAQPQIEAVFVQWADTWRVAQGPNQAASAAPLPGWSTAADMALARAVAEHGAAAISDAAQAGGGLPPMVSLTVAQRTLQQSGWRLPPATVQEMLPMLSARVGDTVRLFHEFVAAAQQAAASKPQHGTVPSGG